MVWKDYETLDVTPEIATKKELEKLYKQNDKIKHEPVNKGGRADIFKKRHPKWLFCNLNNNQSSKNVYYFGCCYM